MPLIRLKKATPGNIVLIDFSSKHEVGKSSEKRVNPLRQKLDTVKYTYNYCLEKEDVVIEVDGKEHHHPK